MSNSPNTGFVACIEDGVLTSQALLLFESIRLYSGLFSGCELYALSPRPGRVITPDARGRLRDLNVHYIDESLNTDCPEYGSANRVAAAAYIEDKCNHDTLVILDSDTVFLREPVAFNLPSNVDVAVRPVDVKGMCSSGSEDPYDAYWHDLCQCNGVEYSDVPLITSFVDSQRVKASYNGGLVVARGDLGIMRRWADYFFTSIVRGLRPRTTDKPLRSGAGWVVPRAHELWGSNQAALSLAIWSTTRRVQLLPPTYNYPLHMHRNIPPETRDVTFPSLVHAHYHWLFEADELSSNPLLQSNGPSSREQIEWLISRSPIE